MDKQEYDRMREELERVNTLGKLGPNEGGLSYTEAAKQRVEIIHRFTNSPQLGEAQHV